MSVWMTVAKHSLKFLLKKEGLCVWPVNKESLAYKLGLLWGVTLSWPGEDDIIKKEANIVKEKTEQVAQKHNLTASYDGPMMAAGGALVVYCGFENDLLRMAVRKAKEQNKPIWQVCKEDAEVIAELAKS